MLSIEHRLIPPQHPQTHGMVKRCNGRINEVLNTTRCNRAEPLSATLARYALLYNQQLPQKALDHRTPIEAMQEWQRSHPELFVKRIRKLTRPDTRTIPPYARHRD